MKEQAHKEMPIKGARSTPWEGVSSSNGAGKAQDTHVKEKKKSCRFLQLSHSKSYGLGFKA